MGAGMGVAARVQYRKIKESLDGTGGWAEGHDRYVVRAEHE